MFFHQLDFPLQLHGFLDRLHHPYTYTCYCGKHFCNPLLYHYYIAIILAAFAAKRNVADRESAYVTTILRQELFQSPKERLDCITQLASTVVDLAVMCPTDSLQMPHNDDDVSSYMSNVLGIGSFVLDMENAICEKDDQIVELSSAAFKQAGKIKYSFEALHLLFNVTVVLSKERSHELTSNRTCNTNGRISCNKPLNLHLEHTN